MTYLSPEQVTQLLRPIHPSRVTVRKDDGLSHLEAYDVRAHLNRIFGFGRWSADLIDLTALYEQMSEKTNKDKTSTWEVVSVGYRATMRLTVRAPDGTVLATYTEAAAGSATNFPVTKRSDAADFAIKTAESQALKRCVTNLGDQFGLSLYQKGSRDALVKATLVGAETTNEPVDEHVIPVTPEAGEEAQAQASAQVTSPDTSAVPGSAESTPPAAPPTATPDDEAAQQEAQAQTAKLREAALHLVAPDFTGTRQDAIVGLGRINLQAGKQRLLQQPVRKENGEEVTVGVFLDDLLKRVSRSAA